MPSPNELTVLRTAMELGAVTKRKISRKMEITTEYGDYLLKCLHRKDYLSLASPGKYELTTKGGDALLFQLHHMKGILAARAYGHIRMIDNVNRRISEYEDFVMNKTINRYRSEQGREGQVSNTAKEPKAL